MGNYFKSTIIVIVLFLFFGLLVYIFALSFRQGAREEKVKHQVLKPISPAPQPALEPPQPVIKPSPQSPAPAISTSPSPTQTVAVVIPSPPIPRFKPAIAIIIDDFGNFKEIEEQFVALPFPITISVLPEREFTGEISREIQLSGKTMLLHLPMETIVPRETGITRINTGMSENEVRDIIGKDLAEVPGVVGVNNHEGSKATSDPKVMEEVLKVLKEKNLFFVDSKTAPTSVAGEVAARLGIPFLERQVFLDNQNDPEYVKGQLLELIQIAKKRGSALAIGHPRPATLEVLKTELPALLEKEGVELLSVKDLLERSKNYEKEKQF